MDKFQKTELINIVDPLVRPEWLELFKKGSELLTYEPWWEFIFERFSQDGRWDAAKIQAQIQGNREFFCRLYDVAHAIAHESYEWEGEQKRYQMSENGLLLWETKAWIVLEKNYWIDAEEIDRRIRGDNEDWLDSDGDGIVLEGERKIEPHRKNPGFGRGYKTLGMATMQQVQEAKWLPYSYQEYRVACNDGTLQGIPIQKTYPSEFIWKSLPVWEWQWKEIQSC